MTITLETYYERIIWKEWSNRIKILSEHKIRQLFYPNNMDILDLIVKNCIKKRREAIAHSRKFSLLPRGDSTQDERNIWTNHTANIYEFSQTIYDHMSDYDTVLDFIEEIIAMENNRLHTIEASMAIRIQKADEEEAVESLMLLHKRIFQKEARERKREENTKNPPPLRRSSRRTAGINAPISGAKVDTILPDQKY